MTVQEAINVFKGFKFTPREMKAVAMAVEALEKQIPIEHHHTRIDHIVDDVRISICPSCLGVIPSHRTEYPNYCIGCGQRIDWGNENDRED